MRFKLWRVVVTMLVVLLTADFAWAQCDRWVPFVSGGQVGLSEDGNFPGGHAMVQYNGDLVVGGYFLTAGGQTVNKIARWDGTAWHPFVAGGQIGVSTGFFDSVYALAVYNGDLIAAGGFETAGGQTVNSIARWDGSAWHPLGSGVQVESRVFALAVYQGELIVGGNFHTAGGQTVNKIARWDGTAWHPFTVDGHIGVSGDIGNVTSLFVYNGELIVGGNFTHAGNQLVNRIARWDGTTWHPFQAPEGQIGVSDGSISTTVRSLAIHSGDLIVGGNFTVAGGQEVNHIARWNGSAWHPFVSGGQIGVHSDSTHSVYTTQVFQNDLIAGGQFETAGGKTVNNIARWDGSSGGWHPFDVGGQIGITGGSMPWGTRVYALAVHGGDLIAAGDFTHAGGALVNFIARWLDCALHSCQGFCGSQTPSGCWCDADCFGFGDCCDDVCYHCTHAPCSCAGNCGSTAPHGCWCDSACFGFGDCCADVCTHCDDLNGCLGACCFAGLPCEIRFEAECVIGGGTFQGIGSTCGADACPGPDSCIGSCGTSAPGGCWCDNLCIGYGDCCDDACAECNVAGCDTSCNSNCGNFTGSCWCDSQCFGFGDCCDDVCTWCEGSTCSCPADLNNDGVVDVSDLLVLLSNWGACSGFCTADINDDGVVDVSDLLMLLSGWGPCPAALAAPPVANARDLDVRAGQGDAHAIPALSETNSMHEGKRP